MDLNSSSEKVVAVVINCVHKQLISSESTEPELIGCNAHLIKLATKNAIEEDENISNMIQKFRRVFKHFKKSGHARAVLDQVKLNLNVFCNEHSSRDKNQDQNEKRF